MIKTPPTSNQRVTLNTLSGGDRFYFYGDRNKTVFQLSENAPFTRVIQKGWVKNFAICLKIIGSVTTVEKHLSDRLVIYLRSVK